MTNEVGEQVIEAAGFRQEALPNAPTSHHVTFTESETVWKYVWPIRKRSKANRLMRFPKLVRSHYRILRKYCGRRVSFKTAWTLALLVLK